MVMAVFQQDFIYKNKQQDQNWLVKGDFLTTKHDGMQDLLVFRRLNFERLHISQSVVSTKQLQSVNQQKDGSCL